MSKLGYIRGFDGLRGIAVFLVFLMHENHLAYQMNVGYYGVWLFFLLSGFLITSQLYFAHEAVANRKSTPTVELLGFWRRRFLRIFPAYYFLLIVTVVLYLAAGKSLQGIGFHFTYTTNIYYEYITKDLTSIFSHFWSLAVEEQFYLLFAPLVLFARSVSIRTALLSLFAISVLARVVLTAANVDEVLVYIDSFVNFGVIAVGGLTFLYRDAIISRINPAGRGGVAVILFVLFIASIGVIYAIPLQFVYLRQLAFVVSVFITALLLVSVLASPSARFTALLEWRPLAFLGRLSYGFYLYHSYFTANIPEKLLELLGKRSAAIASFAQTVHDPEHWLRGSALQTSGFVVSFAVTLLVSYISWRLIEQPALRFRHSKPARSEVAVASAT